MALSRVKERARISAALSRVEREQEVSGTVPCRERARRSMACTVPCEGESEDFSGTVPCEERVKRSAALFHVEREREGQWHCPV